jgi:hypothetical protein
LFPSSNLRLRLSIAGFLIISGNMNCGIPNRAIFSFIRFRFQKECLWGFFSSLGTKNEGVEWVNLNPHKYKKKFELNLMTLDVAVVFPLSLLHPCT